MRRGLKTKRFAHGIEYGQRFGTCYNRCTKGVSTHSTGIRIELKIKQLAVGAGVASIQFTRKSILTQSHKKRSAFRARLTLAPISNRNTRRRRGPRTRIRTEGWMCGACCTCRTPRYRISWKTTKRNDVAVSKSWMQSA